MQIRVDSLNMMVEVWCQVSAVEAVGAAVRLLSCMCPDMLAQSAWVRTTVAAVGAPVGLLTRMYPYVLFQVPTTRRRVLTELAPVQGHEWLSSQLGLWHHELRGGGGGGRGGDGDRGGTRQHISRARRCNLHRVGGQGFRSTGGGREISRLSCPPRVCSPRPPLERDASVTLACWLPLVPYLLSSILLHFILPLFFATSALSFSGCLGMFRTSFGF